MNTPLHTPKGDVSRAAAAGHLVAARAAAERGTPPPVPPGRPDGPLPAEYRSAAHALAAGYDLLAAEVVARMSIIEQRLPSAVRLNALRAQRPPRYIDTPI